METKSKGDITFQVVYSKKKIKNFGNNIENGTFVTVGKNVK